MPITYADMAELADAHGSGPCDRKVMEVQVLLSAPNHSKTNHFVIGDCFRIVSFGIVIGIP